MVSLKHKWAIFAVMLFFASSVSATTVIPPIPTAILLVTVAVLTLSAFLAAFTILEGDWRSGLIGFLVLLIFTVVILQFIIGTTPTPTPPTPLGGCANITAPGSYILTGDGDAMGGVDCIYINSDDVSVDCDSYSLSNATYDIIEVEDGLHNVNVSNCHIDCMAASGVWGIELDHANNFNIYENNVTTCEEGIVLYDVNSSSITYNDVNNTEEGIDLSNSYGNIIAGNQVNYNTNTGISDLLGSGNVFTSNSLTQNNGSYTTILLLTCLNETVSYNQIFNNEGDGIWLEDTNLSLIDSNNIDLNTYTSIDIIVSFNNTIVGNNATNSATGVYLDGCGNYTPCPHADFNIIYSNWFENNTYAGVYAYYANNNTISGNTVDTNYDGIFFDANSGDNEVQDNTVVSNSDYDFYCDDLWVVEGPFNQTDLGSNTCGTVYLCDTNPTDWLTSCPPA